MRSTTVARRLPSAAPVLALAALAALAGSLAAQRLVGAEASHDAPCSNGQVTQAVTEVTGVAPLGKVCNPALYGAPWATAAELKASVTAVMDRCGVSNRYLTQAVVELTGVPPSGGACNRSVYETWVAERLGPSYSIDWGRYRDPQYPKESVLSAIDQTFSTCDRKWIAQAVISQTGHYPLTLIDQQPPGAFSGAGLNGQCNPWLYDHGAWYSYERLAELVRERAQATPCSTAGGSQYDEVNVAFQQLTGWNPTGWECNIALYGAGSWASFSELKTRAYHGLFCHQRNIGQIFWFSKGRRVDGRSFSGECNPLLYEDGTGVPGSTPRERYEELERRLGVTVSSLAAAGIDLDDDGDAVVNGKDVPSDAILLGNPQTKTFATGDGNRFADVKLSGTSGVISVGGGNVISTGGLNLISDKGLGVISTGGGNASGSGVGN